MKSILIFSVFFIQIKAIASDEAPKLLIQKSNVTQTQGLKVRIFCSIEKGSTPLSFEWFKNDQKLDLKSNTNYKIETSTDLSIFTIESVLSSDAGKYLCSVANAFGTDSQNVLLTVRVPPTWIKEPNDVRVRAGEDVIVECIADGLPKPVTKWISSKGTVIEGEILNVAKYRTGSTETFECISDNGIGDSLRKTITVSFSVPAKFDEKYSLLQVKKGESARLRCNATGDQPIAVKWTKDNVKLDKIGNQNYEIFETTTEKGINSELLLRNTQRTDGSIYKCEAKNGHGSDERTIKLVVVEVPGAPTNLRIKEVWSRSVSIVWIEPYSGNFPITKYVVQYWRKDSAPHRLHEFNVTNTHTAVIIKDLSPGLSYVMTVVAVNEVGRSLAADTITFTTGEEEPTAPPYDITVESRGPTTIRVTWRSPPIEHCNGVIKGYYVGYRKALEPNFPFVLISVEAKPTQVTKDSETVVYEHFVRNLLKGTEYTVVVKAYNSAGSGPQSHEMLVYTRDGDLPPAQQLSAIDTTLNSISLRWYLKDIRESQSSPITGYSISYQRDGDSKWIEVPISSYTTPTSETELQSYSYVLENLETGTYYKMFVSAINRYGMSDPSNIVVTKTEGDIPILQSEIFTSFTNSNYYLQPQFTIPLLTAIVIIVIVLITAFICVKRARPLPDNGFMLDSATLQKRLSTYSGTTPRYMDFEKPGTKALMINDSENAFPIPYATLPMGSSTGDPQWDRQFGGHVSMKKDSHHIYDNPH